MILQKFDDKPPEEKVHYSGGKNSTTRNETQSYLKTLDEYEMMSIKFLYKNDFILFDYKPTYEN